MKRTRGARMTRLIAGAACAGAACLLMLFALLLSNGEDAAGMLFLLLALGLFLAAVLLPSNTNRV